MTILEFLSLDQSSDPFDDPALSDHYELNKQGRRVSVFASAEPPTVLYAYWHLEAGYISTYMEEPRPEYPDALGQSGLDTLLSSITIELINDLPLVGWSPPVRGGDIREIDRRPLTTFVPKAFYDEAGNSDAWPVVRFRKEPSWTRESGPNIAGNSDGSWVEASLTIPGIRIACEGPGAHKQELTQACEHMAQTFELGRSASGDRKRGSKWSELSL